MEYEAESMDCCMDSEADSMDCCMEYEADSMDLGGFSDGFCIEIHGNALNSVEMH